MNGPELLKCPDCSEIITGGRRCDCGYRAPPPKSFRATGRAVPGITDRLVLDRLKLMGLERRPDESIAEHATRCRRFVFEKYAGVLPDAVKRTASAPPPKPKDDDDAPPF